SEPVGGECEPRDTNSIGRVAGHFVLERLQIVGRSHVLDRTRERNRPPRPNLTGGGENLGRRDVVERAAPVVGAPTRCLREALIEGAELGRAEGGRDALVTVAAPRPTPTHRRRSCPSH